MKLGLQRRFVLRLGSYGYETLIWKNSQIYITYSFGNYSDDPCVAVYRRICAFYGLRGTILP